MFELQHFNTILCEMCIVNRIFAACVFAVSVAFLLRS